MAVSAASSSSPRALSAALVLLCLAAATQTGAAVPIIRAITGQVPPVLKPVYLAIKDRPQYSTAAGFLKNAFATAPLVAYINKNPRVTMFIPTNAAIMQLTTKNPKLTSSMTTLKAVATFHVIPVTLAPLQFKALPVGTAFKTMQGELMQKVPGPVPTGLYVKAQGDANPKGAAQIVGALYNSPTLSAYGVSKVLAPKTVTTLLVR